MGSSTYWFIKLMICYVFLCTYVQISSTQPLFADDDDTQTSVDNFLLNNYIATSGQFPSHNSHRFNLPENFYHHQAHQLFDPNADNVQLAKRIIMLPRVGRRSVSDE